MVVGGTGKYWQVSFTSVPLPLYQLAQTVRSQPTYGFGTSRRPFTIAHMGKNPDHTALT
jgi:hypothetical protein